MCSFLFDRQYLWHSRDVIKSGRQPEGRLNQECVCVFMMVINRRRATIQNRNKSRHLISISMEKLSSKFKQFASSSEVHHQQRWRSTPSPHLSIWSLWLGDFNCGPISICGTIEIGDVTRIDRSIVCHLSSGFFELIYIFCDNSNAASVIQQPCIGCAKKSRKFVVVVSRWEIATVKTMTIITRKVQFTSCWSNSDCNACEGERDRFKMGSLPAYPSSSSR